MERSDATTLQLIKLYKKSSYLCDKIAAYATLSRDFVAHSRDKLRDKIACVTSVLVRKVNRVHIKLSYCRDSVCLIDNILSKLDSLGHISSLTMCV